MPRPQPPALGAGLLLSLFAGCATPTSGGPAPPPNVPASRPADSQVDAALARAATFLLQHQSADGAFRSEKYRALADGRALTPLVLSTLLFAAEVPGLGPAYDRGVDFVASLVRDDGSLDEGPYGLEYPVYTLSLSILVLSLPRNQRHAARRDAMLTALESRQLGPANGWGPTDLAFGGWGYFPGRPVKPKVPDELLTSNLTSTTFSVGALLLGGRGLEEPRFAEARAFVERCQNFAEPPRGPADDGGFFHTPNDEIPNKAGGDGGRFRSYGTTTADGLRALLRLGVSREAPRAKAATEWLLAHFDPERVPGAYPPDREIFRDSAYYYWSWTAAHALMQLGPIALEDPRTRDWPGRLQAALLARQRPDGSFVNSATDLREDDPLVATGLAGAALAVTRMMRAEALITAVPMIR